MHNPARVEVTPVATTAERIEHTSRSSIAATRSSCSPISSDSIPRASCSRLVRMKHMANKLVEQLAKHEIRAEGDPRQQVAGRPHPRARQLRTGRSRVLIATDIAARGIDVKGISLVVNYDLPEEPESYVHRIGRTARAGRDGMAVAFCDDSERNLLRPSRAPHPPPDPGAQGPSLRGLRAQARTERGPLGDGIDRPHRPSGPPRREGGFRSRFRR